MIHHHTEKKQCDIYPELSHLSVILQELYCCLYCPWRWGTPIQTVRFDLGYSECLPKIDHCHYENTKLIIFTKCFDIEKRVLLYFNWKTFNWNTLES